MGLSRLCGASAMGKCFFIQFRCELDVLFSTGYANHGDYLFGWQGDALQRALDSPCYQNCPTLKTQDADAMNKCTVPRVVMEEIDDCKYSSKVRRVEANI
jgi:hypothetical protein